MRKIFIALCTMVSVITGNAQNTPIGENIELAGENPEELKVIYVNKDVSTHFIAMEDIKYVDISVNDIVGDIPTGNSLRIKPTKEGASGVITIVTERFFVQYMLVYSSDLAKAYTRFNIPYADLRSYMNPEVNLTKAQMYDYAHRMFISKNKFYDVSSKSIALSFFVAKAQTTKIRETPNIAAVIYPATLKDVLLNSPDHPFIWFNPSTASFIFFSPFF